MTARHIYIDETKERGYVLVASAHIADNHLSELRKTMREFVLRGQTRVHMAKESDQRRRTICAAICAASVNATIYDAGRPALPRPTGRSQRLSARRHQRHHRRRGNPYRP
ncbi:hypothetical protein [Mycobacterium avium]|uniref:hypothetical protein n=1 Tax=Mycobacterium avium TaxID=1764 RepID=UPI0020C75DEC|nr:hypothetical protein [Mycobacterium avium]